MLHTNATTVLAYSRTSNLPLLRITDKNYTVLKIFHFLKDIFSYEFMTKPHGILIYRFIVSINRSPLVH